MRGSDVKAMAVALRRLLRAHGVWVALLVAMLFTAAPGVARAQATCAIDFSVAYNAQDHAHVMSMTSNFDEFAACDPRYIANPGDPASGFAPYVQSGPSANGGSFVTAVNAADDTITYDAPTGFSGVDTFTVYFCNDASCSGAGARVATVTVTVATPTIAVNPTTLPNATVAAAYSQTLTGSGGEAPYGGFTVITGALPAGLSLAAGGALTGTPTASGSFNFTIRTTDSTGGTGPFQGSRAYSLTVNAPTVTVSPTTLPAAAVGSAYSQTITGGGGTAPYGNFTVTAGALPAGLSLNSSSGALTGTPTAGGSFNFTIRTTDSTTGAGPHNGSRAYALTVNAPTIVVSPTSLPAGAEGSAYSQTITAAGGTSAYSFAVTSGTLPAGLTLAAGGALTGTPTVNGSFPITITATDSSTGTASPYAGARGYTLVINAPPAPVANAVSRTVAYNSTANTVTLTITGGAATSIATPGLPSHGTVNIAGTSITYTPTTGYAGPDSFTYTASNSGGTSAAATVTITVSPPTITVSPTTLPNGTTSVAYSQNVTAAGGSGTYTYAITAGTQPAGLTLSGAGVLSGTPSGSGPYTFTVTATDTVSTGPASPFTGARAYTVTIVTPDPSIANPVNATVAYNSINNPITLDITGGAPTSVAVSTPAANGTATAVGTAITYTPTPGYFGPDSFAYTATNADGTSAPATVTITINPQPPVANAVSASVAQDSSNNPITLNITGGAAASVNGSAVVNGSLVVGGTSISFTPTPGYNGPASFDYTATNAGGTSAPATVSITVNALPPVANAASVTVAYNSSNNPVTLSITGGTPTSVATPGLPSNGTVNIVGTAITYTPTPGYFGSDSFTYTATNGGGTSAPATVTVTVNPQPPVANTVSATVGQDSSNNPITLSITGGAAASVNGSAVVNGSLVIAGTSISFTPTPGYNGPASFDYTATNAGGTSAPATVSITVTPLPPIANAVSVTVGFESSNNPVTLNITGGTPASVATPGLPSNGSVNVAGTAITYTPNAGYAGPDSFTYTATNTGGTSAPATVAVTVNPPPAPIAGAVSATVAANSSNNPVTLSLTGGTATSLATPGLPTHGTVSIAGAAITYTPTAGYSGADSFTYTATNPGGTSAPATVTLTVSAPTLTLSALAATGQVAAAYSDTVVASLGTAPYTYNVTAGALPSGLALTTAGVLSGTATATGTFNFTVTATDVHGATGARAYAIVISPPTVAITSPGAGALPPVEAYGAYSETFTATGGVGPRSFALTAGALPPGISLSSGGTLSGAPTTPGIYNFSVTPSDSSVSPGPYAGPPVSYSITVTAPAIVLSPAAGALTGRTTALTFTETFTATGGIGPHAFALTAGALPPGVSLTSGGVFSGTPTVAGTYNFTITAEDSHGFTGSAAWSVTIADPTIAVTSPGAGALPSVEAYGAYSQTFTATGGIGPHSFALTAGALPPGMSLSSGGVLSGAPTTPGTFNFTLTASDSSGAPGPFVSAPVAFSVTVTAPTISLTPAPGGLTPRTTAQAFTQTFSATGGVGPYSFSLTAGALPPGVSLTSGGVFSGTPSAAGTYNFTITAEDSHGFSASNAWSVTVSDPTVVLTAPSAGALPGAAAFASYSQTFTATGGIGPHSFALTAGALPPGMSLSSGGVLSGAPTAAGTFNFTLTASDSSGAPGPFVSAPVAFSLVVAAPTVTIASPAAGALSDATATVAYSQTFTAAGGNGTHAFAVTAGALPSGLGLSGAGVLSGIPTTPGTYNFTLVASDTSGAPGPYSSLPVAYSLTVVAPTVTITSPAAGSLPGVIAFGSVNQTFTANGGLGPRTFAVVGGALPAGVSLSGAGLLSGAPTTPGTYNFSIAASDSSGAPGPFTSAAIAYSLVVSAPTISLAPATLPDGTTGQAYAQALTASGGTTPYTYSLTAGALPAGITLAGGGSLSGTPTAAGTFGFTVTVTDAHGFTAANAWSLVIIDAAPVAGPDSATTPANQAVAVPVTTNDTGVITRVAVAAAPAHGTAVASGLTVTYTPAPDYFGPDSFTYTATGPGGTSAPAAVSVTVTPLAVPTAAAKVITVLAGQAGSVDATAGSTGAPITAVSIAAPPAHGNATVSGQTLIYTPAAGYAGADSFTYTLANPFGTSAPATVTVTVNPAPITAAPITVEILAGQTASVNLTAGASGGPFTGAALVSLTPSTAGTGAITNPVAGQYGLTFSPAADFAGTVTAAYTLSNAFATSAAGTVTVIVTARPDPAADPEVTGLISAQGETARRFATAQISNVNNRLESLRDGGGAGASLQLSFSGGSRDLATDNDPLRRRLGDDDSWTDVLPSLSYGGGLANEADSARAAGTDMSAVSGRFGLWAAGGIDFGQRDATTGQQGVEFDTDGLTAGADLRVNDQFLLGTSVGWGHDESRIGDDGTRSDADGYSYAVYGSYQPGARFFVDGLFGYGTLKFDSRRYITASGDFAYGERDGSQWFGAVTGGWDMRNGRRLLSPYGRLSATQSDLGAYSETSGGAYALAYESQTARTLTGTFGLRGSWSYLTSFGEVVPRFRVEYSRDVQGSDRANLFYVDWVDGPVYGVDLDPLDQNRALGGIGLDVFTFTGSRFSFEYETTVGSGAEQHQVRVRIESPF